jgi:hypothetical protein
VAGSVLDLYQRLEREVRVPARRLLVDAFLPPPETLESTVAPPPPPPPLPGETDEMELLSRLDRDAGPEPPPPPKARRKKPVPKKAERAKSLQEEIEEFMHRDGAALSPESDPVASGGGEPAAGARPGKPGSDDPGDGGDPPADPSA